MPAQARCARTTADRTADSVGDEVEPTAPCDRPEPRPSGAPGGLGPCRLALAVTLLVAALPGDVLAWPGIRTPSLAEHVAGLFHRPEQVGMSKGDAPFARLRKPQGLLEADRPFASKKVEIDSTGVHYTPHTAGFPSGTPVSLALEDYLDIGLQHTYQTSWYTSLRRIQKAGAVQVRRRGTSRLEWKVPFPAPKPIRRFIGDEGSLRINGQHTATVSGKSQWTSGEVRTLAGRPSRFPALSLDQESKFLVEGSVGEAINVRIDQNTAGVGTGFGGFRDQLANQIKLDYKGDEDAVFQEIQAGNTTLALPATRLVGFNQQSKGLFGIRAKGHLGPMAFTTIASHEKSESNRQSFRGGAQVDTLTIFDYAYLRNTYFFLDHVYRDRLDDFRKVASGSPADLVAADIIDEATLQVYVNDFNVNNDAVDQAQAGVAHVDLDNLLEGAGFNEKGTWTLLDPDDGYTLVKEFGYIILRVAVQERHALAVRYRTRGGGVFGGGAPGEELKLKLIKARDARPEFPTWNLEWKNVYKIVRGFSRGRQFEVDKIRVEVLEDVPGREPQASQGGKNLLQIVGLDEHGQDPGTAPDQIIDADYIGLDPSRGILIFPDLRPFDPQSPQYDGLSTKVPEIYDKHQVRDQREASRYLIQVVNSSAQQRINLSRGRLANIDPKSVEVTLNGLRLVQGTDYNVSFTGEVTFMGGAQQTASDPGADLEITFESQDLFGIGSQQKTLLGMRGEYEFLGGDATVGGTVLYNNERSSDRRVRVGGEPARTLVWDVDLKANFQAPLLTRVVDALPLLKTAAKSNVTLQAEIAQSRPNLNTKGAGYIDDFEGSERPETLSIFRTRWTLSSQPKVLEFDQDNRGKMIWYNPFDRVLREEIWPGQADQVEARNNQTDVLVLELIPAGDPTWGGIMTAWSAGMRDFSQSKFIEIWLRGDVGELHVDLGAISEDANGDGIRNTEDKPFAGRLTGDGVTSPEEDIGIDGRDDRAELKYYLALAGIDTTALSEEQLRQQFGALSEYRDRDPQDPEGDNFRFDNKNKNDYSHVNGTEGNLEKDAGGQRPDTEDLNNDGILNDSDDYFHHVIDLATDPHVPDSRSPAGWRLYRLPLYDQDVERVGKPDSSRVEYGRITFVAPANATSTVRVELAKIEIIGNEWQEDDIVVLEDGLPVRDDEKFNITTVGTDESLSYRPPIKIRRQTTGSRAFEREQSLVLEYENLDPNHQAAATKVLTKTTDYTKYTRLQMFVHGDSLDSYVVDGISELEMFVRFGRDSTNYYEFATRVYPQWDPRNHVDIDLLTMSQLKAELQRGRVDSLGNPVTILDSLIVSEARDGEPAVYRVRGNPSMQQIKQLSVGVRNHSILTAYTGRIFADELRLEDPRNDAGFAAYARVNTALADFMNLDGSVEWRGEDFRTISSTGRKSSDYKTSLSTTTNAHKLLPGSWGFSVPIKASFSRRVSLPRFGPNSDVELRSDEKQEQKTESTKSFYEISISKRLGKSWLTRWTIDNMNLRLSKTRERGFSPTRPLDRKDNERMSFSYKMPLPKPSVKFMRWLPEFMPKGMRESRLRFLPTSANYSMNVNRQEQAIFQRSNPDTTFREDFTLKETYTTKVNPLTVLQGDYSLQINRDLRKKYDAAKFSFGREVSRNQKADLKLTLRLARWLDQSYTYQANFEEINDPRKRRTQAVFDSETGRPILTRDVTTKSNMSANVSLKLPLVFKSLGKRGDSKSEDGQPFFLRRLLYFSGGVVEPIKGTWRRNSNVRNFNLTGRPSLSYQLGLDDSLRVTKAVSGLTQQDTRSRNTNVDLSTGLRLPLGFSIKPSFKETVTRRSGSTQTRLRVKEDQVFPRLTVNWGRANRLPYIKKLFNSAQVNVSYDKTKTLEGEGSLRSRSLIEQSESQRTQASWNGQWRFGPSTRISYTKNRGTNVDFELVSALDTLAAGEKPPLRGSSSLEKSTTTVEVKYNLRPRHLPLFGDLKSNVNLKFKVEVESETRSSATGEQAAAPISATGRWKVELNGTYKFSDNFRGQGIIRVENNRNRLTEKTRKLREVRMSGTLFFK